MENNGTIGVLKVRRRRLIIPACDGTRVFSEMRKEYGEIYFVDQQTVQKNHVTKKVIVDVYKSVCDATFVQMLAPFGNDLDRFCLTQHQIDFFFRRHYYTCSFFKAPYGIFFLLKEKDQYVLANIRLHTFHYLSGLIFPLDHPFIWLAEHNPLLVLPQQVV